MTLRSTLAALLAAGCSLPSLAPVPIASVADAPAHPEARSFSLTAQSVPSVRGVGTWSIRHSRSVGTNDLNSFEVWVVPLVDPGAALNGPVTAWVTPPENQPAGTSAEPWLAELAAGLDGKPVTLKVAARAADARKRDASWGKAIADAETRLGVQSHPDAPILFFPSP